MDSSHLKFAEFQLPVARSVAAQGALSHEVGPKPAILLPVNIARRIIPHRIVWLDDVVPLEVTGQAKSDPSSGACRYGGRIEFC